MVKSDSTLEVQDMESLPVPENEVNPIGSQDAESLKGVFSRLILTERRNIPLLFWALVVGTLAGILGGVFRIAVEHAVKLRYWILNWGSQYEVLNWVLPILFSAIFLTLALFLVRRFAPETSGSGVQEMEGALDEIRPVRWKRVLPIKFIGGLFSLGSGMVLGREGPTIQMGGALGAMVSQGVRASKLDRHCLIAAGAGAGLAAAFNAPLAGILFVFEEMRPQFKYNFLSVTGVMMACAVSDIAVRALTSQAPVIQMNAFNWPPLKSLWVFVVLGSLFGVMGYFFNHFLMGTLEYISSWKRGWRHLTGLIIGGGIGLLGFWIPGAIGGGYEVIPNALKFHFATWFMLVLFALRFGTTVVSYGSGAPGGIFAPMLALGTIFGIWFGEITMTYIPGLIDHPAVFAVAGMGALFSATVRAPLTGIALAIEMTGNYSQILPLIITCMSATLVAHGMGGKPIYSQLLRRTLRLAHTKED